MACQLNYSIVSSHLTWMSLTIVICICLPVLESLKRLHLEAKMRSPISCNHKILHKIFHRNKGQEERGRLRVKFHFENQIKESFHFQQRFLWWSWDFFKQSFLFSAEFYGGVEGEKKKKEKKQSCLFSLNLLFLSFLLLLTE